MKLGLHNTIMKRFITRVRTLLQHHTRDVKKKMHKCQVETLPPALVRTHAPADWPPARRLHRPSAFPTRSSRAALSRRVPTLECARTLWITRSNVYSARATAHHGVHACAHSDHPIIRLGARTIILCRRIAPRAHDASC